MSRINPKVKLNFIFLITIIISISFIACEKKEPVKPISGVVNDSNLIDKNSGIIGSIKNKVEGEIKFFESGNYSKNSSLENYAVGTEFSSDENFGIKFSNFTVENNLVNKKYETDILNGSFTVGKVEKIQLDGIDNELVYFNSGGYFIGSAGGEIFGYIIDFQNEKYYYAHFITTPKLPLSLYLSPDTKQNKAVQNYFLTEFRKDYPDFKIINEDHILEDVF